MSFAQQSYTGIISDNYVSSFTASINPSTIVDSKSKFAIHSQLNSSKISNFCANDFPIYGHSSRYVESKKSGYKNNYLTVDLLNLKYEINHKNAFAYSFKFKDFNNLRGIPSIWAENMTKNFENNTTNQSQDITGASISRLWFTEHAFTYARTIVDKEISFLKVGVTLKILNGLEAKYFHANSGTAIFNNFNPNMQIDNLNADFGKNYSNTQAKYKNNGLGLDLGFTYEYRPNSKDQYYEMDSEMKNVRYNMNKYKLKIAGSITDIGWIRFMKDTSYYNFSNNSAQVFGDSIYDINSIFNIPFKNISNTLQNSGVKSPQQESKFKMNLPTSIHLSIDYNVVRNIYVNYNVSIPISFANDKTKISNFFIQTITPRIEKEKYSIMMPISQMGNGKFYFGLAGRVKYKKVSILAGSNNLSILYGLKSSLSRNVFVGISYSILYGIIADKDFDKISDGLDDCPSDKGLAEFNGCPDSDGDKIIDLKDNCIYDKGPKTTNGCPDRDNDGTVDMNDMCPDIPGLGIHFGCPDRDFDGVIDAADRCPDEAGIELNNGCPFENQGCCNDNDGDGVTNKADKCPEISGSVYNDGCPIDSTNINKINLQDQKSKKDANNTKKQKELNKSTIDKRHDFISSNDEMKTLIKDIEVDKEYTAYFDIDQATLSVEEQKNFDAFVKSVPIDSKTTLMIIGYTDKDGSLDYNLILSKKRAETIKRKLIDAGYPDVKIVVYYYGETKLIHKGSYTKEMKTEDRKVEIKVVKSK